MNSQATALSGDCQEKKYSWKTVLEERNMRWYFGTQLISLMGLMLRSALLSLLIIDVVGKEKAPPLVGLVWALNVFPGTFLAVFAGHVSDKYSKQRILQITAILGMLQACVLAYFTIGNVKMVQIWIIMTIAGFGGVTSVFDSVSRTTIIKEAVREKKNEGHAMAMFNSLYTVGMILGSYLAGILVMSIGYPGAFMVNCFSFVVLLIGLHQMDFSHKKIVPPRELPQTPTLGLSWFMRLRIGVKDMWHETFADEGIRICILLSSAIVIFGYAYNIILPIINKVMFNGTPKDYSFLAMMAGCGSFVGSIAAMHWCLRAPIAWIVAGSLTMGLALLGFAHSTSIHGAAPLVFLCGLGFMMAFMPFRPNLNRLAKGHRIGLVMGTNFAFFYGGMTVSSYLSGYMAKHVSCGAVLMTCGVALILVALSTPFLPGIKVGIEKMA